MYAPITFPPAPVLVFQDRPFGKWLDSVQAMYIVNSHCLVNIVLSM